MLFELSWKVDNMAIKINITIDPDIENTKLTPRQKQVLQVIREFIKERGYPPTVREAGQRLGLTSSASIHAHMSSLEKAGFISRDQTKPRALEINPEYTNFSTNTITIPLVGQVTAGLPILANENIEEVYAFPANLLSGKNHQDLFMLTVIGDSMINAGIFDGDIIVVRKQTMANNGEIVVALINNEEATVKRFYKNSKKIILYPENDAYQPIEGTQITILGKVISVFRNL